MAVGLRHSLSRLVNTLPLAKLDVRLEGSEERLSSGNEIHQYDARSIGSATQIHVFDRYVEARQIALSRNVYHCAVVILYKGVKAHARKVGCQ
jgi:hypothetical protein